MTLSIEYSSSHETRGKKLNELVGVCRDITSRYTPDLDPVGILNMSTDDQEALIAKLNPYLEFEYGQIPELQNVPITIRGYGTMLISDLEGCLLGGETISGDDVITGTLYEVCAAPIPTVESVDHSGLDGTPIMGQTISGVLLLKDGRYFSGKMPDGNFMVEHDLDLFQIGIPLSHPFTVS